MQQNSARVVYPTRRDFVKYHGKDSADSRREEILEVPYNNFIHFFPLIGTIRTAHTIHRATRQAAIGTHTASNAAKRSSTSGHGLLYLRKPVTFPARFAREVRITRKIQAGYQPCRAAKPVRLAPCPKGMVIR